jgi:hypothetical protein
MASSFNKVEWNDNPQATTKLQPMAARSGTEGKEFGSICTIDESMVRVEKFLRMGAPATLATGRHARVKSLPRWQ